MNLFRKKRIFLDYASSTPLLPEVKKAMEKYWSEHFHNPSAIYKEGVIVGKEVADWRLRLARELGVSAKSVIFTSGGTESGNLAILGTFYKSLETFKKPHVIISAIEHPAILAAADEVVRRGGEVSILEVDESGLVSVEHLKKLLKKNTCLVSVALANSEIGTVQPISALGRIVREERKKGGSIYPLLHTDASNAPSYLNVELERLHADLLTLDSSKIYGPRGIGALVIRSGVSIHPIIFGGGQEGGRRSGTASPALIAGFVTAFEIAKRDKEKELKRLENVRKLFVSIVENSLPQAVVNGSRESRLPSIVSVSIPGALSELLAIKLDKEGVMVSVGTACSYDQMISGSPVLRALGAPELAESTVRFSFGRFSTREEVKRAAEIFCRVSKSVVK